MNEISCEEIAQNLVRLKSITPLEAGCYDYIQSLLIPVGFHCQVIKIENVTNFYSAYKKSSNPSKNIVFLGHVDVVPAPKEDEWIHPPFAGIIHENKLYGRGACDMKGAIAAFISAAKDYIIRSSESFDYQISILLTSDEEGEAINGVTKMIPWLKEKGEKFDLCIVGEPTNPEALGQMIKVGRRGSISFKLNITGIEGHIAYPEKALNPLAAMTECLHSLNQLILDQGNEYFQPSNLEISSIDTNNPTGNVIPKSCEACFNIRFNTEYTAEELIQLIKKNVENSINKLSPNYQWTLTSSVSAHPFLTQDHSYVQMFSDVVENITNIKPQISTSGGTSDARFMHTLCPIFEFGLISDQAHKTNEHLKIHELHQLKKIYKQFLTQFFQ